MTKLDRVLSSGEAAQLAACETVIARGVQTFVAVGSALMRVRDGQLYRTQHKTFEDYCAQRWSISRPRAYELMNAAGVVSAIADKIEVAPPSNEAQARELAKIPEPDRAEVWSEAVERTAGAPTAAAVREVREERAQPAALVDAVKQAIEEVVAPDPDDPHREWRRAFLAALGQGRRAMQFDIEDAASRADDECVDELRRLVLSVRRVQGRKVRSEAGEVIDQQELIELWTWEQIVAKRAEAIRERRVYTDKIAHYDKLLALREWCPDSSSPADAAKQLGMNLDAFLGPEEKAA